MRSVLGVHRRSSVVKTRYEPATGTCGPCVRPVRTGLKSTSMQHCS